MYDDIVALGPHQFQRMSDQRLSQVHENLLNRKRSEIKTLLVTVFIVGFLVWLMDPINVWWKWLIFVILCLFPISGFHYCLIVHNRIQYAEIELRIRNQAESGD